MRNLVFPQSICHSVEPKKRMIQLRKNEMQITKINNLSLSSMVVLMALVVFASAALAIEHPYPNPTNKLITPRKDQTEDQQYTDQLKCYDWTCELLDWDPYLAYDALVEEGYTVALDQKEIERGLVCLATQGAVAGSVAGEVVGRPGNGAAIGAAMAVTAGLIQSSYLLLPDDPQAQRVITRFESQLHKWETKFAGCLSREGYRVHFE